MAGVLGKSTDKWRKPKRDSPEELRRKAVEFEEHWAPFENDGGGGSSSHGPGIASLASLKDESEPEGPDLPPGMV